MGGMWGDWFVWFGLILFVFGLLGLDWIFVFVLFVWTGAAARLRLAGTCVEPVDRRQKS